MYAAALTSANEIELLVYFVYMWNYHEKNRMNETLLFTRTTIVIYCRGKFI